MNNGLKLNNTRNIFVIILSLQIAIISLFFLNNVGISLAYLQEGLSIVYLLFIPGFLIIRLLKVDDNIIEIILYSLGLSIAFLMVVGLMMNLLYPIVGIKNPISFLSIFITVNSIVIVMLVIAFIKNKTLDKQFILKSNVFKCRAFYFLLILPVISVIGTYIMNTLNINLFLMILFLLISLIPIAVAWNKFIPKDLYPFAVFMISLSLLFSSSLISFYIWGYDINNEYYLSNLVITNGLWNPQIFEETNSMLSIVMLAPILSIFSGINLIWIYKIMYPFIFAFVPLVLYKIFQKQTNSKIAFFGSFFFMSFFVFFHEMLQLARQEIAELFLVLLLLVLIDENIVKMKKAVILLIFSSTLIVSHYGLSYIFIGLLILTFILSYVYQKRVPILNKIPIFNNQSNFYSKIISSTIVLFVIVLSISWYSYTSNSLSFSIMIKLASNVLGSFSDLMNPESAQGLSIIVSNTATKVGMVTKYLQLFAQALIVIGVISIIFNYVKVNLKREYLGFIIGSLILCFAAIFVPFVGSALNTSRLYQISLIFLSVFCIIGGITALKVIPKSSISLDKSLKIISIFLAIFLLFNSGFVNQIFNEPSYIALTNNIDYPKFNSLEVSGSNWIFNYYDYKNKICADDYRYLILQDYFESVTTLEYYNVLPINSYLYLGTLNVQNNTLAMRERWGISHTINYNDLNVYTNRSNKIYDNSGSQVFYKGQWY